jgi:hypothetical protein
MFIELLFQDLSTQVLFPLREFVRVLFGDRKLQSVNLERYPILSL